MAVRACAAWAPFGEAMYTASTAPLRRSAWTSVITETFADAVAAAEVGEGIAITAVTSRDAAKARAFADRRGLFDEHVHAGGDGGARLRGVGAVRRGDVHRVDGAAVVFEGMRNVYDPGFAALRDVLPELGTLRRASFSYHGTDRVDAQVPEGAAAERRIEDRGSLAGEDAVVAPIPARPATA
jgi:hypothetical protein